jgi:hypothetical protein
MQKIKLVISLIVLSLFILVSPVMAATVNLSITGLPAYITTNSFKLSYSCLGCTSVQFSVSKNGGSWNSFGSAMTDASGQVQVTSSQVDEQTSYAFKVVDASGIEAKTETFYDISGPSPVSGYYKDGLGDGNKLHWKNPSDSDFSKVLIYRSETSDFSADGSHNIAEVAGGAGSDMTYDDHTPDSSKTYYYALRALDRAGNSSSLVGDAGTTVLGTSTQTTTAPGTSSTVVNLPKETQGEVLPESTEALNKEAVTQESKGAVGKVVEFAKNRTKLTVLILAGLGLAGYLLYRKVRKG